MQAKFFWFLLLFALDCGIVWYALTYGALPLIALLEPTEVIK